MKEWPEPWHALVSLMNVDTMSTRCLIFNLVPCVLKSFRWHCWWTSGRINHTDTIWIILDLIDPNMKSVGKCCGQASVIVHFLFPNPHPIVSIEVHKWQFPLKSLSCYCREYFCFSIQKLLSSPCWVLLQQHLSHMPLNTQRRETSS